MIEFTTESDLNKTGKTLMIDAPVLSSDTLLDALYNPNEGKYFGFSREQIQQVRDSCFTEKQKQQWVIDALKKQGYSAIAYKSNFKNKGGYSLVSFNELSE